MLGCAVCLRQVSNAGKSATLSETAANATTSGAMPAADLARASAGGRAPRGRRAARTGADENSQSVQTVLREAGTRLLIAARTLSPVSTC